MVVLPVSVLRKEPRRCNRPILRPSSVAPSQTECRKIHRKGKAGMATCGSSGQSRRTSCEVRRVGLTPNKTPRPDLRPRARHQALKHPNSSTPQESPRPKAQATPMAPNPNHAFKIQITAYTSNHLLRITEFVKRKPIQTPNNLHGSIASFGTRETLSRESRFRMHNLS